MPTHGPLTFWSILAVPYTPLSSVNCWKAFFDHAINVMTRACSERMEVEGVCVGMHVFQGVQRNQSSLTLGIQTAITTKRPPCKFFCKPNKRTVVVVSKIGADGARCKKISNVTKWAEKNPYSQEFIDKTIVFLDTDIQA